jgi:hypothetical protein
MDSGKRCSRPTSDCCGGAATELPLEPGAARLGASHGARVEVVAGAVGSGTREGGEKAALRLGVQAAVLCAWRSMPMRGCAMTV